MKIECKKNSLNVLLLGLLGYTSFSISLLWNLMNMVTLMLILSSIIFIIILFYINHILKFKEFSFIVTKGCVFLFLLYIVSKILVIFLHETGHAISALFNNVPLYEVRIVSWFLGISSIGESSSSVILSVIAISGGLGIIIILFLVLIGLLISRKELKGEVFIPVYIVTSAHLFEEIRYWCTSIPNKFGDGWEFMQLNPQIDYFIIFFITNTILWTVTTILFLILVLPFLKRFFRQFKPRFLN